MKKLNTEKNFVLNQVLFFRIGNNRISHLIKTNPKTNKHKNEWR